MCFYSLISSLILFLLFISDSECVKTLKHLAARSGGSLSIPCLYDEKHKSNSKYWCKGYHWISCNIIMYASTSGRTPVTDHPSQNMFTVDPNNLRDSDTGWYWCGVRTEPGTLDYGDSVHLTVSADPAVWVRNSRVSGHEGGSASVQCFYSSQYKDVQKQWCRFKDWSCCPFQNSSVQISDDEKRGSFRVEMIGLQKRDAGWYWFSAGEVAVTVHLTVTERPTTTTAAVTTVSTTQETTVPLTTGKSEKTIAPQNPPAEGRLSCPGKYIKPVEFCIAQN